MHAFHARVSLGVVSPRPHLLDAEPVGEVGDDVADELFGVVRVDALRHAEDVADVVEEGSGNAVCLPRLEEHGHEVAGVEVHDREHFAVLRPVEVESPGDR